EAASMTIRSGVYLGLTGFVCFVLVSVAAAQGVKPATNPSHIPIPGGPADPKEAERQLAARLGKAQDQAALQTLFANPAIKKLAQDILDHPERYKQLQDQIDKLKDRDKLLDPNDPASRELLNKLLDPKLLPNTSELDKIPPLQREEMKKLLE